MFAPKKPKAVKAKETAQANRSQQRPRLRQRKRRPKRKRLTPTTLAPDSSGAILFHDTPDKSRRETPLWFLPDPHPARLPADARRLRDRTTFRACYETRAVLHFGTS